MKKIGVLISGGGTNLQALIDGCKIGEIKGEIAVVISSKPGVFGLERAAKHGIPAEFCSNQVDVLNILNKFQVELVVLAGYLKILDPELIRAFPERIINIHPSLIPSFCGKGYYGERVHEAVYEKGVKVTGATTHYVDEGTDTGPIIMQEAVPIDEETPKEIAKKVLEVEHRILVKTVSYAVSEKLIVKDNRVYKRKEIQ